MEPKKILLAEDDPDDCTFFLDCVKERDDLSIIATVEDGEKVFRFLDKITTQVEYPDLIILDQNMPRKNGYQTLETLKLTKRYQHIPVVIYSTHIDDLLKLKSLSMGAVLVMHKPSSPNEYHAMLTSILESI